MKNVKKGEQSKETFNTSGKIQALSEQDLVAVVGGDVRRNSVNVGFQHLFKKKKKK